MNYNFDPIEGLWRFHLIYMVLMLILGLSFIPLDIYPSFFLVSGVALVGLLADRWRRFLTSHVVAVAIGLLSPFIFFLSLLWWHTAVVLIIMIILGYWFREYLF